MNILLIGPLPDPVTGEALANQTFINYLKKNHIPHAYINTTGYNNIQSSHGKFTFSKLLQFIGIYQNVPKVAGHKGVVYITIGQTFFGVVKYTPFIITAVFLKKPYYLHLHGNYLGQTYQSLSGIKKKWFHWVISHAQGGIVLSESLKPNFQHLLPEKSIQEVENFADDILYRIDISQKQFQQLHLLFLSNLYPEKGIVDFLDALLMLQQSNIPFKASIGGSFEVSSKHIVLEKMRKIDEKSIEYHGFVSGSQKQELLQKANVFVLPTYYKIEGQPISIIEALATGNIIVTTRQGGIPDIISEKQGFFVEKNNPANLFETLQYVSQNLSRLAYLSEQNRYYAKQRFSEDRFGKNLLQVLSGT
jgi:glycosyltransferase involved in cell wall biosynthesis